MGKLNIKGLQNSLNGLESSYKRINEVSNALVGSISTTGQVLTKYVTEPLSNVGVEAVNMSAIYGQSMNETASITVTASAEMGQIAANMQSVGQGALMVSEPTSTFNEQMGLLGLMTSNAGIQFMNLITPLGSILATIGPLFTSVGQVAGIMSELGVVINFLTNPIGIVIAAIVALVAVFMYLWNTNEAFRNAILEIWQTLSTALSDIFNSIYEVIMYVLTMIQEFWNNWGETILALVQGIWEQISIIIETAINLVKDIIGLVLAVIRGDWEEVWNRIKSIGETIWNYITSSVENVKNTLANIWDSVKDKVLDVWDGIFSGIKGVINKIIGAINGMISAMNRIHFSVPDWVPKIGGKSFGFNIPKIPMLANGGIITKPTLAVIGESGPEAVLPLDRYNNVNNSSPTTLILELDGKTIAKKTFEQMGGTLRLKGAVT